MKIELKRITFSPRLSEETNAFAADIWIDGVKVGHAKNAGQGGNTNIYIKSRELWKQALEYAKSLPPIKGESGDLQMNLESYIDLTVEDFLVKKEENTQLKRWCKKDIVFRCKGNEKNSWIRQHGIFTPAVATALRKEFGDKLEEIANERYL